MEQEEQFVKKLFSSIAPRYDCANTVLTFGLDALWRKKLVRLSHISKDSKVLDCAAGTGKLAFCFSKKLGASGQVTAVDFCQGMLDQVKTKDPKVIFQKADVLNLPFNSNTFDVVSIAYGLRNLSDQKKGLKEMARVAKPQGLVMILETGSLFHPLLSPFFHVYFKKILPILGGWITGKKEAYEYLSRSSLDFPSGKKMAAFLNQTGCFKTIHCFSLLGGASFIYKAEVL